MQRRLRRLRGMPNVNLLTSVSSESTPLHLVFVERGRRAPGTSSREQRERTLVWTESSGASTRAAVQRITHLEQTGRCIDSAEILVAAADARAGADERLRDRVALSVALARHMARAGAGQLTFRAEAKNSKALRSELLALVDVLMSTAGTGGVGLRVQFEPSRDDGGEVAGAAANTLTLLD